jgi:hypothetical protein
MRARSRQVVHQLEAGTGLAEGGDGVDGPAHDLAAALALGVADLEVLLLRPGGGDPLEGGVGDVLADPALDGDLGAAPHLDVLDDARVALGEELRERVPGLVHVVVGVEDRKVELTRRHRGLPMRT